MFKKSEMEMETVTGMETGMEIERESFFSRFVRKKNALDDAQSFSLFCGTFASLINRGYSPVRAVCAIADAAYSRGGKKKELMKHIYSIAEQLRDGISLKDAFEAEDYFPDEFTAIVGAGEKSGKLDSTLKSYSEYLSAYITVKKSFRGAMTYPTIMLSAIVIAIFGFGAFLVPGILTEIMRKAGKTVSDLILPGKFLFALSYLVNIAGKPGAVLLCLGTLYWMWGPGRRKVEKLFLLVPAMSRLFIRLSWATWMRTMAMCLMSGMSMRESLEACTTTSPPELADDYDDVVESTLEGSPLSKEMKDRDADMLLCLSIEMAEESGSVPEMMLNVSDQYVAGMEIEIKQAASAMEPIVIAILTILGGGIVMSLMLTILSLSFGR